MSPGSRAGSAGEYRHRLSSRTRPLCCRRTHRRPAPLHHLPCRVPGRHTIAVDAYGVGPTQNDSVDMCMNSSEGNHRSIVMSACLMAGAIAAGAGCNIAHGINGDHGDCVMIASPHMPAAACWWCRRSSAVCWPVGAAGGCGIGYHIPPEVRLAVRLLPARQRATSVAFGTDRPTCELWCRSCLQQSRKIATHQVRCCAAVRDVERLAAGSPISCANLSAAGPASSVWLL